MILEQELGKLLPKIALQVIPQIESNLYYWESQLQMDAVLKEQ